MKTGEKLDKLFREKRLGPRPAAKLIGVASPTTIDRWRKGEGEPGLNDALKIARFFGIPVESLEDDDEEDFNPPKAALVSRALSQDEDDVLKFFRLSRLTAADLVARLTAQHVMSVRDLSDEELAALRKRLTRKPRAASRVKGQKKDPT